VRRPAPEPRRTGGLEVALSTVDGKSYVFRVVREGEKLLLRASARLVTGQPSLLQALRPPKSC